MTDADPGSEPETDGDEDASATAGASPAGGPDRVGAPTAVDDRQGEVLLRVSWAGTALYAVVALATMAAVSTFQGVLIGVTMLLFVVGLIAFFAAYVIAIGRSREVLIGMGGLYFLAGPTAPRRVRVQFLSSFAVEVVVATVTSILGTATLPDDATNPLAFGFLVPLFGLGLAGLWGARYGSFAPRPPDPPRPTRRRPSRDAPDGAGAPDAPDDVLPG